VLNTGVLRAAKQRNFLQARCARLRGGALLLLGFSVTHTFATLASRMAAELCECQCGKRFHPRIYRLHLKGSKCGGSVHCGVCNRDLSSSAAFNHHRRGDVCFVPLQCQVCSTWLNHRQSYDAHTRSPCARMPKYPCFFIERGCTQIFWDVQQRVKHQQACEYCPNVMTRPIAITDTELMVANTGLQTSSAKRHKVGDFRDEIKTHRDALVKAQPMVSTESSRSTSASTIQELEQLVSQFSLSHPDPRLSFCQKHSSRTCGIQTLLAALDPVHRHRSIRRGTIVNQNQRPCITAKRAIETLRQGHMIFEIFLLTDHVLTKHIWHHSFLCFGHDDQGNTLLYAVSGCFGVGLCYTPPHRNSNGGGTAIFFADDPNALKYFFIAEAKDPKDADALFGDFKYHTAAVWLRQLSEKLQATKDKGDKKVTLTVFVQRPGQTVVIPRGALHADITLASSTTRHASMGVSLAE
jgi:hypothetical protein